MEKKLAIKEKLAIMNLRDKGVYSFTIEFGGGGDDGGVVVIPAAMVNNEMLEKLHRIELQEDVWLYCLNTLKWDTKRIVCDKEYLENIDVLPDGYKEYVGQLSKPLDQH